MTVETSEQLHALRLDLAQADAAAERRQQLVEGVLERHMAQQLPIRGEGEELPERISPSSEREIAAMVRRLEAGEEEIATRLQRVDSISEGLQQQAVGSPSSEHRLKGLMAAGLSTILMLAALWVILTRRYEDAEKKWAFGIIGTVVGYWLAP